MAEMQTYIAWANDKKILKSSASGGIFQALANYFLSDSMACDSGCTVYGAWHDINTFTVKHRGVNSPEDISLLIGSKYYQSEMQGVYPEIKKKLKDGQRIMFSGTPCQVAGLKSYLNCAGITFEDQLLTVEVLCHGVSSRKVVMRYIEWMEEKSGKKIQDIHFRTKKRRWYDKGSSMEVYYMDGTEKVIDRHVDPFYLAFNQSINLRPSCYSCHFAKIDRIADITLGDFWGAENYTNNKKQLHDGIGLVMVNTTAGRTFWNRVQDSITSEPINIEIAIPRNGAIIKPVNKPQLRKRFFDELDKYNFGDLIKHCFGRKRLLKIRIKGIVGEERLSRLKNVFRHS